ncbi:hypothetical protein GA0115249_116373 [Streptomyces sp. PpalLS-921]|nr:hypothetical protein GA0115249_116373 [Streptomyces sp. PpalLS-921]
MAADTSGLPNRRQRNPYRATAPHSQGETAGLPAVRETVPRQMPLLIDHYGRAVVPSSSAECSPVGNHLPPDGRLTRAMTVSSGHRAPYARKGVEPSRRLGRHRRPLSRTPSEEGAAPAPDPRPVRTDGHERRHRHRVVKLFYTSLLTVVETPGEQTAKPVQSAQDGVRRAGLPAPPRKRPPPRPRRPDRHGRTPPPPGTRCIRMASSAGQPLGDPGHLPAGPSPVGPAVTTSTLRKALVRASAAHLSGGRADLSASAEGTLVPRTATRR